MVGRMSRRLPRRCSSELTGLKIGVKECLLRFVSCVGRDAYTLGLYFSFFHVSIFMYSLKKLGFEFEYQ